MSYYFFRHTKLASFEREMMEVPGFGRRRNEKDEKQTEKKTPKRCKKELEIMKHPIHAYQFPSREGSFTGRLVKKRRNGLGGLNCYFDSDDGRAIKLCAWDNGFPGGTYKPRNTDIDIFKVPRRTRMRASYRTSHSGKTQWLEAEVLKPDGKYHGRKDEKQ